MEYEDFRITIAARVNGGNRIYIESPAGSFMGTFANPIDKSSLDNMLMSSGLKVRSSDDVRSKTGLQEIKRVETTDALDDVGNQISRALFQREVLDAYAQSQALVDVRGKGLRIKIRIDPDIEEYVELMSLPWEFLYDDTRKKRTELMNNRAVVRDPITPTPVTSLDVEPPLKVLAVVSDPVDYPPLKLGREETFLKEMSKKVSNIEVKFLQRITIQALNREMDRQKYHILHFMGHGGFDGSRCTLIFKGRNNKGISVNGDMLKLALPDSVRLVFLNACETARISEADPFAAIPTELLLQGVPAVLSMQFPISDKAAIKFCEHFYRHLVEGHPIDQCMGVGRKEVFFEKDISAEWGTPVLFMRSADGMIFKIKQGSQGKPAG